MSTDRIVVASPFTKVQSLAKLFFRDEVVHWLYLGNNYLERRRIEKELGNKFQRTDIARLNDSIARQIRHEYIDWIDDLNRRYGHNIEWWFGSISSRNIYDSNIFQYFCYLEILKRLSKNAEPMPKLIVVESLGLAKSIKKWGEENTFRVVFAGHQFRLSIKQKVRFILRWGNFITNVMSRCIAAFLTRCLFGKKALNEKPLYIVDTFIHDYCVSDEGIFKDRYFPYLHEYLQDKGKHILIHPVLHGFSYQYFSIYKRMRISDSHFIIPEDFLRLQDYLSSLTHPIRVIGERIGTTRFRECDVDDIIQEDHRYHSSIAGMHPILIYRLFTRLGKQGLRPQTVINWYENQVIDKALICGCRKAFPDAQILGAQIFTHTMNDLSLFPCSSEVEFKVTPDVLLETSAFQCERVKTYTKAVSCFPVAALRYAHLFLNQPSSASGMERNLIVVLLPFDISGAIELLEIVKEGLVWLQNDFKIAVKCHPDFTSHDLVRAFGRDQWPSGFYIYDGDLQDALEQAAVVISSNSSSIVEAAAKGIPVVFVGRQTVLNQNPLEDSNDGIYTECFTSKELTQAINGYSHISADEIRRLKYVGANLRDTYYSPINEHTMLPFLGERLFEATTGHTGRRD